MMIAAPTTSSNVEDVGDFSADSIQHEELNSDDEQLDDTPFLSHQLSDDQESFSEKFLRNILTHDYQNLMPRRREKFVEITKTVTVTEIVNGAPDKHPSTCEVKVTNVSPAGLHPVNVSIKHLHEKWHSCDELNQSDNGGDLGKGTVIHIQETHKPFNYTQKRNQPSTRTVYEDVVNTKMEQTARPRQPPSSENIPLFNRSSDNVMDLKFRHPVLIETSEEKSSKTNESNNGTRRRFADLRKKVSTTTRTSVTETEKVTTTRRSSSAHSTSSSRRAYGKPEVRTLYYRKFVDEDTKNGDEDNDSSDSGSVIIHRNSVTRRSRSADPLLNGQSHVTSPIAPPRKRLGREESLHYYRDDDEVTEERTRRVTVRSPEPGNTSVSMNDTSEGRNITAGITSISMNDSCTDASFESRFSTIPRARSSPPGIQNIHVNIIGPIRSPEVRRRSHHIAGRVGEDVTMDIRIEKRRRSASNSRSHHDTYQEVIESSEVPPPKPPRRSKYDENTTRIGEPLATSTPMTTIERKHTRQESEHSSRKSTRSSRPPDINIIECESFIRETRSPARTPATPIVVINQTPSSRRGSQDLLSEPGGQRRRKSTVTDIDWYAAFNMKDPSSPTKLAKPPFGPHGDERKASRDIRRRASDSSMIGIPPADIDLNQIFSCTAPPEIKKDEKCQCNACRLIRMSEAERASRIERATRSRQSRSFTRIAEYETRSSTLPSRHRTSPVKIHLDDIFNPQPQPSKPPTPPHRRRIDPSSAQSSIVDESSRHVTSSIDRSQVTSVTNSNSRDSGTQLHDLSRNQLLTLSVDQMIQDANDWESQRKTSVSSNASSLTPNVRKISVARRISIDELTKPEKKKSREAVPLPPSDVSIDDIFTALVPKDSEKKSFIVTRKQRAQDVDIIDFEEISGEPVAPPRTKKDEISTAKIVLSEDSNGSDENDDKNMSGAYKKPETNVSSSIKMRPSESSIDENSRTSTVNIDLDKVFVQGTTTQSESTEIDEKIRRGIAEFEKSKHEKEAQRSGIASSVIHTRTELDDSNISMDDVFATQNKPTPTFTSTESVKLQESEKEESSQQEKISRSTTALDTSPPTKILPDNSKISIGDIFCSPNKETDNGSAQQNVTSTASIPLELPEKPSERPGDEIFFTEATENVNDEIAEEETRIQKRVEEFERAVEEREARKHEIPTQSPTGSSSESEIKMSPVSIDLDKVFVDVSSTDDKSDQYDEEDEKIKQRISEFERSEQEKASRRSNVVETSHSSLRLLEDSNISIDDIFNTEKKQENASTGMEQDGTVKNENVFLQEANDINEEEARIHQRVAEFEDAKRDQQAKKDIRLAEQDTSSNDFIESSKNRTSEVNINLEDVFTKNLTGVKDDEKDEGEEKIKRRIAEFRRSEQEKASQRSNIAETSHSCVRLLDDSNISIDDIFDTEKNRTNVESVSPHLTSTAREKDETTTAEQKVFLQVAGKEDGNDNEEERIHQRVAEFEKAKKDQQAQREITTAQKNVTSSASIPDDSSENRTSPVNITLDDVFLKASTEIVGNGENDEEDEKIKRRIAEFQRSEQEKASQRSTAVESSYSSSIRFDYSNISMDDVFSHGNKPDDDEVQSSIMTTEIRELQSRKESQDSSPKTTEARSVQPTEISEVSISLDKIESNTAPTSNDEDERIQQRIAEFEKAQQEKESHRTGVTKDTSSRPRIFEESTISIDEIFDLKNTTESKEYEKDECDREEKELTMIDEEEKRIENRISEFEEAAEEKKLNLEMLEADKDCEAAEPVGPPSDINLDEVFVKGTSETNKDYDEEEKIKRGIAEFEKSQEEKRLQNMSNAETSKSQKTIISESNISVDEIFRNQKESESSEIIDVRTEESPRMSRTMSELKNGFDDIFPREKTENVNDEVAEEEQRIQKRVEEFEKAVEEREALKHDIPVQPTIEKSSESERKMSPVSIDLNKVFVDVSSTDDKKDQYDEEDEKIKRRIAEFKRSEQEKASRRSNVVETSHSSSIQLGYSNISMDDVFAPQNDPPPTFTSTESVKLQESQIENDTDDFIAEECSQQEKRSRSTTSLENFSSTKSFPDNSKISIGDIFCSPNKETDNGSAQQNVTSTASIPLEVPEEPSERSSDDIFFTEATENVDDEIAEEEKRIQKRVEEFEKAVEERENLKHDRPAQSPTETSSESEIKMSPVSIDLDKVFVDISSTDDKKDQYDEEDEKIQRRIAEFKRSEQEKASRRSNVAETSHSSFIHLDYSNISMDDVFNPESASIGTEHPDQKSDVTSTARIQLQSKQEEIPDQQADCDENIRSGIKELEKSKREKEVQEASVADKSNSSKESVASNISMDDIFNVSRNRDQEGFSGHDSKGPNRENANNFMENVFSETSTSTTTTTTETTQSSFSRRTVSTLDDMFGPQTPTPPTISVSSEPAAPTSTRSQKSTHNLVNLTVPGNWNDSMISNASTISLDESFTAPKLREPLTLPVDNWIDDIVANATEEATREAPKTPTANFRSPTRISQEIKYEWVADLVGKGNSEEPKEEHQSDEEHLQKQDNLWVSSVVYRPTLETRAYTLRASQADEDLPKHVEIDMNDVFEECLRKTENEECECSACQVTEDELEEIRRRKIEKETLSKEEATTVTERLEKRWNISPMSPSDISIDAVFNPEEPLHIQTGHVPVPSSLSPPLQPTRTYYISPKVSETVTTTHQWKDADISMDEIFSPVSSTTNENRRFSNFYEDRSGWDTIGSEDSGVMSGGDRGRRRSTRVTDQVIDEAFKDIFEQQPSTSQGTPKLENQYDDFYITSLNQEDARSSDSEVDGENLDVSQFVDDILGRSMDEAAFLSSTKSLKDHTDTSIDRKKSFEKVNQYYRTRTDTSIDRRSKPEVIKEDLETQESQSADEIMNLIFVDHSDSKMTKSESGKNLSQKKSASRPADDELLEIEIKPEYFLIKGSYSLLIPKSEPLGQMLQKLRDQHDSLATLDFSLTRKLKKLLINCIREKAGCLDMASSSKYDGLSSRGQSLIESVDHASATFLKMNVNKFDPARNPQGIVNFCTAENNICTPLLEEHFKHLELFFPNVEHLVRYPPSGGWPEAREVLVKYFKEFMNAKVKTDELVLTASTRTGYDVTSYCLFEQDDILLTNGPAYAGTISNVQEKALCKVECVETDLSNPRLDVKKYEEELNRQTELENVVSGVIIVNPHNPLGVTFPPEDVVNLCNWAASKNLKVVIDEVFANCVFDKANSKFCPFLSYRHRVHRPENVAWLWSVSKDFGLPGLKFAVIQTANEGLRQAATKLQMYYPCSPFVQTFTVNLLSDSDWLREFHTEVTRRIAIHYRYTAENLKHLGIPFVPAQAGIFVFADFSKHLPSNDEAGELELFERIAKAGVMLTPGVHQKCHVYGWFRIVFACSKEELEEGFKKLCRYFGSHIRPVGAVQYSV